MSAAVRWTTYASPLGTLTLTASGAGLTGVRFPEEGATLPDAGRADAPFAAAVRQLDEYFAGARTAFALPLDPVAGSDFARSVWREVARIPHGRTISYAELARRVGRPGHVRAVGGANARNPLPIVVPCHRVIGSRGGLTGYSGGFDRKRALLDLEASALDPRGPSRRGSRPRR